MGRLTDVAAQHKGVVPLHSRLFMQWMHFAYPRECPYPHLSGTTHSTRVDEVVKDDISLFVASREDMMAHISAPMPNITAESDAMWTMDEEMIVWQQADALELPPSFKGVYLMGSVVSASLMLVRILQTSLGHAGDLGYSPSAEKYYV